MSKDPEPKGSILGLDGMGATGHSNRPLVNSSGQVSSIIFKDSYLVEFLLGRD